MYLAKTTDPKILSDINENEVKLCAALYTIAIKMKDEMLMNFLTNFLLLRVSKSRKGRGELLQIAQSAREATQEKMGRLARIFQGIRGG
jgi:hypothetical protein